MDVLVPALLFVGATATALVLGYVGVWIVRRQAGLPVVKTGPLPNLQPRPDPAWLVPIGHELVQTAAEQALRKGMRSIYRDGDQLYFNLEVIPQLTDREQARLLLTRFYQGEDVDLKLMLNVVNQLTREN